MSSAFILSTTQFTAGILTGPRRSLRFQASHSATLPLQDRLFRSPEAAQLAVQRIIAKKQAPNTVSEPVSCRPVW